MTLFVLVCAASLAVGLLAEPVLAMPPQYTRLAGVRACEWWLPLFDHNADRYVTWRSSRWWWQVAGPCFRRLIAWGVWYVPEGDYYVNGRVQWPPDPHGLKRWTAAQAERRSRLRNPQR